MFRVTKAEERSKTTITIDGHLSGESVATVETCCNQAGSDGKPVQLYLRDVTSVDQAGKNLLSRLAAKGVGLAAAGVYTSYLIQTLSCGESDSRNSPFGHNGIAGTKEH
jgi:hypothetical protein